MTKLIFLCLILVSCTAFSKKTHYHPTPNKYGNEINCLAKNIYFEARDQPSKGQIAVALVTINRVKSNRFPNTICKVVQQANRYKNGKLKKNMCQFSWYCDGLTDVPKERLAWKISLLIAQAMLRYPVVEDFLHGATHYHNLDVDPYWNRKMLKVMTIGHHIFYIDPLGPK